MKKTSKKYREPPRKTASRKKWPGVRHLGFVVDTEQPPANAVTHALVNLEDLPDLWYVVNLSKGSYPPGSRASVPRYFHTLFVIAVNALSKHDELGGLEHQATILEKHIPQYAKIASDLRQWARADKNKSSSPDYPKLRMAIHSSLFAAYGRNKPLEVIWKDKATPDRLFFWKPGKLQNLHLDLPGNDPFQSVTIRRLCPQSEFAPRNLIGLADSLIVDDHGCSWQDLYRRALRDSTYVHNVIELSASSRIDSHLQDTEHASNSQRVSPSEMNTPGNARKIFKILRDNPKVLLFGPSGSGKTTTLRYLAWHSAIALGEPGEQRVVPLYVPMKWFGLWPREKNPPRLSSYFAFWVRETIERTVSTSELAQCDLFARKTDSKQSPRDRNDMLSAIAQAVESFFSDATQSLSSIMLLLDGMNEVPEGSRHLADTELAQLLGRIDKAVLTTRPHRSAPAFGGVEEFELSELSDEQLTEYLSMTLGDKGHDLPTLLQNDPGILSMARNPFCLSLIVEKVNDEPEAGIPDNRALLIKDFIQRLMLRKQSEGAVLRDDVKDSLLFTVLPSVAKWSLDRLTQTEGTGTTSFHESSHCQSIQGPPVDIFEGLRIAEKYGLLTSSGLPAAFHQTGEYPEFLHDNIRDYFAAVYLKGMQQPEFISSLPERLEHFVWDEPMLLSLELGTTEQALRNVVEHVVPVDLVLASMCVRCAKGIDDHAILDIERRVRNSTGYKVRVESLPYGFDKSYSRPVFKLLPVHILGRLPLKTLLDLSLHPQKEDDAVHSKWVAVITNVTQDYFAQLEALWHSLPQNDAISRFGVFMAICGIPSRAAFEKAVRIYKEVHAAPKTCPLLTKMMGSEFLLGIKYQFSLSEVCAEFSAEEYKEELNALASHVAKARTEDVPMLQRLLSRGFPYLCQELADLLAKILGEAAIPIFLECLSDSLSLGSYFGHERVIEFFYERITDLNSRRAFEILIRHAKRENEYSTATLTWQLLIKTHDRRLIPHAIRAALQSPRSGSAFLCTDYLRSWPVRNEVVDHFTQYTKERPHLTESDILLGASLGVEELISDARTIFKGLWLAVILGRRKPPPQDALLRVLYEQDPDGWHENRRNRKQRLLSLAYPAGIDSLLESGARRLWRLMNWAYSHLSANGMCGEVNYELLAQSLQSIQDCASTETQPAIVKEFLHSEMFTNLFRLAVQTSPSLRKFSHQRLQTAMTGLIASLPSHLADTLLPKAELLYVGSLAHAQDSSGEFDRSRAADLLLNMCQRASSPAVQGILRSISTLPSDIDNEKNRQATMQLGRKIEFAKGKRFLATGTKRS